MSAFTPGPWHVVTENESIGSVEAADGSSVAQAQMRGSIRLPMNDERRANTRLIAAAPELLAALIEQAEAEQWIAGNDEESPFFEATYTNMLAAARASRAAAIAKATGKEPS